MLLECFFGMHHEYDVDELQGTFDIFLIVGAC